MEIINSFIQRLKIPANEVVLLAGDLNLDLYADNAHLKHLNYKLGLVAPQLTLDSHPFTVDPKQNWMVGNDNPKEYFNREWPNGCEEVYYDTMKCVCCPEQWLDYVLYSKKHLVPTTATMQALPLTVEPFSMSVNIHKTVPDMRDVSDHYPVLAKFSFAAETVTVALKQQIKDTPLAPRTKVNTNEHQTITTIGWVVIFLVLLLIVISLCYIVVKRLWAGRQKQQQDTANKY
jgi:hypothetical protein